MTRTMRQALRAFMGPRQVTKRVPPQIRPYRYQLDARRIRKVLKNTFVFELLFVLLFGLIGIIATIAITQSAVPLENDFVGTNIHEDHEWDTYVYRTDTAGVYRFRIFLPDPLEKYGNIPGVSSEHWDYLVVKMSLIQAQIGDLAIPVKQEFYKTGNVEAVTDSSSSGVALDDNWLVSKTVTSDEMTPLEEEFSGQCERLIDFYWRLPKFHRTADTLATGYIGLDPSKEMYEDKYIRNWMMVAFWVAVNEDDDLNNEYSEHSDADDTNDNNAASLGYSPEDDTKTKWRFNEAIGGKERLFMSLDYPDWIPDIYWEYWRGATPAQSWYPRNVWGYSTEFFIDGVMLPSYLEYILQNLAGELTDVGNYVDLVVDVVNPLEWGNLGENVASNDILEAFGLLFQLLIKFFIDGMAFAAAIILLVVLIIVLLAMLPLLVTIYYQILFWVQVFPPLSLVLIAGALLALDFFGIICLYDFLPFLDFLDEFGGSN